MTPHASLQAAIELVKAHLGKQDLPRYGDGPAEMGKLAGDFVVAMLKEISAAIEKMG